MNEEDIEELKRLFYSDRLTQHGKRKLIEYYEQRIEELEEENETLKNVVSEIFNSEDVTDKYIPVSLVEEKIEDLKMSGGSDGKDNIENTTRELVIEVLQDILDESSENKNE